jgi:hypothetical protein
MTDLTGIIRLWTDGTYTIGQHPSRGYYVHRATGTFGDYLHSDGIWRRETCQVIDGRYLWTGYFKSFEQAEQALKKETA